MAERNIRLIVEQDDGVFTAKHRFVVSIGDNGVEIRHERDPVASRDSSVAFTVGHEPEYTTLVMRVEECA